MAGIHLPKGKSFIMVEETGIGKGVCAVIFSEDRLLILWGHSQKDIPARPAHPGRFPETDARHWYDMEFAGWGVPKRRFTAASRRGSRPSSATSSR